MMGLAGFNGQTMGGSKARGAEFFTAFNPGDTFWTCPRGGYYTFTARGAGGAASGGTGGGGGAAVQRTELLAAGQVVTFSIGQACRFGTGTGNGTATIVNFPGGAAISAGGGFQGGAGGVATGGDVNIAGGAAVGGLGGISPAIVDFGATPVVLSNNTDGPGAGSSTSGGILRNEASSGILYLRAGKAKSH